MKSAKYLTGNVFWLLLLQLYVLHLKAQHELVKPEKMSERTFRHFEEVIQYNDPDSMLFYRPGNDTGAYIKFYYRYNNRHQPVVEDEYKMFGQIYRLEHRIVKTYDPVTAGLQQMDMRVADKVYNDSVSTRTENIYMYDSTGNMAVRYRMDMQDGVLMQSNGDSMVYIYNKNGVPVSAKMYFFGYIGSDWILDKDCKVEGLGKDGNPKIITVSVMNTENEVHPIRQYKSITWAKRCNNLEGIDTLAKEYTEALFSKGKWEDSYKKINFFNAAGQVDSTIVYTFNKNGEPQPSKKDVYMYLGGMDFQSKLHYDYMYAHWQLTEGTRRTFSFGESGDNRYYLNLKEEVYKIPPGGKGGSWKERNKVVIN